MNLARLVAVVIGAGIVSSLTDWFFAGDWLHRRYTYPEIWRQGVERRAIALTSPLPFLTCGVFAYLATGLGVHSVESAVKTGCCRVVDRPVAADPYQCRVHEAAPSFCGVLYGRVINKAHNRCGRSRLVPFWSLH